MRVAMAATTSACQGTSSDNAVQGYKRMRGLLKPSAPVALPNILLFLGFGGADPGRGRSARRSDGGDDAGWEMRVAQAVGAGGPAKYSSFSWIWRCRTGRGRRGWPSTMSRSRTLRSTRSSTRCTGWWSIGTPSSPTSWRSKCV